MFPLDELNHISADDVISCLIADLFLYRLCKHYFLLFEMIIYGCGMDDEFSTGSDYGFFPFTI